MSFDFSSMGKVKNKYVQIHFVDSLWVKTHFQQNNKFQQQKISPVSSETNKSNGTHKASSTAKRFFPDQAGFWILVTFSSLVFFRSYFQGKQAQAKFQKNGGVLSLLQFKFLPRSCCTKRSTDSLSHSLHSFEDAHAFCKQGTIP